MKKLLLILGLLLALSVPCFAVDAPPQVMMYFPVDGQQVFVGQMVGLNATAASVNGVNRLAYYVNGVCVCDAMPIVECRYIIPVGFSQIEIHATAWDTKGMVAQSLPVYIYVSVREGSQPPPPQPETITIPPPSPRRLRGTP